jgi:hypothetical protein
MIHYPYRDDDEDSFGLLGGLRDLGNSFVEDEEIPMFRMR